MAQPALVPVNGTIFNFRPNYPKTKQRFNPISFQDPSQAMATSFYGNCSIIRQAFRKQGYPESALQTMKNSISESIHQQYNVCYKAWWKFCTSRNISRLKSKSDIIIEFLQIQTKLKKSYSHIKSFRSALKLLFTLSDKKLLKRFMKGIYNINPPSPKYDETWDPHKVLLYLDSKLPLEEFS